MADSDRVALRYIEEDPANYGITPDADIASATASAILSQSKYLIASGLDDFYPKQTVLVAGFVNAASNGYKTVVSVTTSAMVVEETIGADESAVGGVSILTAFKNTRLVNESLKQNTETTESQEVRPDRQVPCVKRTNVAAGGDVNVELSYGTYDDFFEAVLESAGWSTIVTSTETTYSMADGDNSINDSGTAFISDGFLANQWIKTSGFTESANNGYFKIVSLAAGKMVLSGRTVVTEAAGDSVTAVMGEQIVNGVTEKSFSVQREYTDVVTDKFALFNGMVFDGFNLSVPADGLITGAFTLLGKLQANATGSTGDGTAEAATTLCPMNATDEVLAILEGMSTQEVTNFTMAIINNMRARQVVGTLGPESYGSGRVGASGTVTMYFENKTIMDKYLDFTDTSLVAIFVDDAGNAYIIDFPRVKYTDGGNPTPGPNTDIVADMTWMAHRHATEDVTVRIVRFAA